MALEDNYGYRVALELVTKGIESGSIKLHGPNSHVDSAAAWAQADAKYIISLMTALQAELPKG